MSKPVIVVENLGKQYRRGQVLFKYKSFREAIMNVVTAPYRRLRSLGGRQTGDEWFWALKDVSFEVQPGEVMGIIGRNGAGKSTLLKILSRITPPTAGRATIRGRVGCLLEVGTGFHPELTGRENIYLNGAILGMKKAEIDRKFDEIVAFAEIEKFLDTSVKHYSSGMYVRLAFAVAAHLETEILLVDEVLAVGDMMFQKKCLGKMNDVAKEEGRTVLFVSHNLGAVANLCPRAILLCEGEKRGDGPSTEVADRYMALGEETRGEVVWDDPSTAPGNDKVRLHAVRIVCDGTVTGEVEIQKDVCVEIEFWNFVPNAQLCSSIHLLDRMGVGVLASGNDSNRMNLAHDEWAGKPYPAGLFRTTCVLPGSLLNDGWYSINVIVLTDVTRAEVFAREVISFNVVETGEMRGAYLGHILGVVRPKLAWQTMCLEKGATGNRS